MDVTPKEVVNMLDKHNRTTLIHGHTHRPAEHALQLASSSGQRWVLGDWGSEGWHIIVDENGPRLESFPL